MITSENKMLPFPRVLRIEPASECNLACSHCPTGTVEMARGIMAEDVFEKVLEEIKLNKEAVKVIVLYHGGEPLLNRNFYSMVAKIKEINSSLLVKTVSNGMALTLKHAKEIISSGIDVIEFSLDGDSPEESQNIREKSNTDKIIKNVQALIDLKKEYQLSKPQIYIATTQFLRSKSLVDIPAEAPVPNWLLEKFSKQVAGIKSTYALQWPHMGDSGNYDFLATQGQDCNECDHIVNTLTIRSNGTVVPCCYDLTSKFEMGSIMNQRLADIWNGKKYQILRKSIKFKNFISICKNCAVVKPPTYLVPKWTQKIVAV